MGALSYESLPTIYCNCSKIGHFFKSCPSYDRDAEVQFDYDSTIKESNARVTKIHKPVLVEVDIELKGNPDVPKPLPNLNAQPSVTKTLPQLHATKTLFSPTANGQHTPHILPSNNTPRQIPQIPSIQTPNQGQIDIISI